MGAAKSSDKRAFKSKPTITELAALAEHLGRSISTGQKYPPFYTLKVGDHVRLVHFPTEYLRPGALFPETRRFYKYLLERKRPVKVCEIDDWGLPWIACQCRDGKGRMEHHWLLIGTESGWVKVKRQRPVKRRK